MIFGTYLNMKDSRSSDNTNCLIAVFLFNKTKNIKGQKRTKFSDVHLLLRNERLIVSFERVIE